MQRFAHSNEHISIRLPPGWFVILLLSILAVPLPALAQSSHKGIADSLNNPALVNAHPPVKKRFGRAALVLGLANVVPWAWDRYGVNANFARISFNTVATNLRPGSWSWDYDDFQTNQIGHPFHGSIFFNAYRSNGYNFWQSAPASFAGSYIWETYAETQLPSPNDFINTGFGGVMLGEVTHRFANRLVNNNSHGFKKQLSEVFACFINPSNGLNRILDGKWGKGPDKDMVKDTTPINAEFDFGLRKFNVNNKNPLKDGHFGGYGRVKIVYGSPSENMKDPFSNISVIIEAGQDDSSKLNIVSVYGSLAGWKIYSQNRTDLAVLSANYDYINNAAFYYSAEGVKMNLYSEFQISDKIKINTSAGVGVVILAAIPDVYTYKSRNYDYGPGLSYNGSAKLGIRNKFFYNLSYRGGLVGTVNGNPSNYLLNALTNELSFMLANGLSINAEEGYFNLHGNYRHFTDVNKTYPYLRVSMKFNVKI